MNRVSRASSSYGLRDAIALSLVAAVGAVFLGAVPAEAGRRRPATLEVEGSLSVGHPLTLRRKGVTQADFLRSCNLPQTQGFDGYVVEVPDALTRSSARTILSGAGTALAVDLDMYYYDDACKEIGATSTAERMEIGVMPAGTSYVVVTSLTGADIEFVFTAEPLRS